MKLNKSQRGASSASKTPVDVRGTLAGQSLKTHIRDALGRKLGKFSTQITRVEIHLSDLSGPKGAPQVSCRAVVSLAGREPVSVEHRAAAPREAFDGMADRVERAIRRDLDRAGLRAPRRPQKATQAPSKKASSKRTPKSRKGNVDTSLPGVSASDKKVGAGSTAERNRSERARRKGGAKLEDSATGKPSRKSTRKSEGHVKRTTNLRAKAVRAQRSPKARAEKAATKR